MKVDLPDQTGRMAAYRQSGTSIAADTLPKGATQVVNTAAHVVADPVNSANPGGSATGAGKRRWSFLPSPPGLALGLPRQWIPRSVAWA